MLAIPLYLKWLGQDGYALHLLTLFVGAFVCFFNIQMVDGAFKRMTEYFTIGDEYKGWRVQQVFFLCNCIVACVSFLFYIGLFLFYPLPKTTPIAPHAQLIFLFAGVGYVFMVMNDTLHPVLYARGMFTQVAIREAIVSFMTTVPAICAVYFFRTPVVLSASIAIATAVGTLINVIIIKRAVPTFRLTPVWDPTIAKDLLKYAKRSYLHRICLTLSTTLDKSLLPFALPIGDLTTYNVPSQIPTTLQGLTDPIQDTLRPELVRQSHEEPQIFGAYIVRCATIVLGVAVCMILIPSAYGVTILKVWGVSKHFNVHSGALVMIMLGIMSSLELTHGVFNNAVYAVGRQHVLVRITIIRVLAVGCLSIPLANFFGVIGLAGVQTGSVMLLLIPLIALSRQTSNADYSVKKTVVKLLVIIIVGLLFAGLGFYISHLSLMQVYPVVCLITIPILMLSCWTILRKTESVPHVHLPGPLAKLEFR